MNLLKYCFLFLSITGCSNSCNKNVDVPKPKPVPTIVVPTVIVTSPPPVEKVPTIVQSNNISFVVPADWEEYKQITDTNVQFAFMNNSISSLLLITSVNFKPSDKMSYDVWALVNLRNLKDNGAVVKETKDLVLNGQPFTYMLAEKEKVAAHMWFTVKNNVGYQISCGSKTVDVTSVCNQIMESLRLK